MTDGYAASPAGPLSLFHAHLIVQALRTMPRHRPFDMETVRILLNLSVGEFDDALSMCRRQHMLPLTIVMALPLEH